MKDAGVSATRPTLYHWHTARQEEVDLLMEARDGRLVGVEVKASSSLTGDAFKGLRALQNSVGERLHRGIVLYSGQHVLPFGDRLWAVPLSALWER